MSKVIRLTESDLTRIVKRIISEMSDPKQLTDDDILASIGYLYNHGTEMKVINDVMKNNEFKNQLLKHLLNLRNKVQSDYNKLPNESKALLNTVLKFVNELPNKNEYITMGKNLNYREIQYGNT
jgi:hypothetical protein